VVVGAIEKAVRSGRDTDNTMVTVLCIAGAVSGGFVGQIARLYVFGEPLGFVFSAAGAELLLFFHRSRDPGKRPSEIGRPVPAPAPAPVMKSRSGLGIRIPEAAGWGGLCGLVIAITAFVAVVVGMKLYEVNPQGSLAVLIYCPIGFVLGFVIAAAARLARPAWTTTHMFMFVAVVAFLCFAFIMRLEKTDAIIEHGYR
jgi:hypothetical protein